MPQRGGDGSRLVADSELGVPRCVRTVPALTRSWSPISADVRPWGGEDEHVRLSRRDRRPISNHSRIIASHLL